MSEPVAPLGREAMLEQRPQEEGLPLEHALVLGDVQEHQVFGHQPLEQQLLDTGLEPPECR